MAVQRTSNPRPERTGGRANSARDGTDEGMRLRFRLSPADGALLRGLASDDEQPADTIRRLIRTAALTRPILAGIEHLLQMPAGAGGPNVAQPAGGEATQDDTVRRQADALAGWLPDD